MLFCSVTKWVALVTWITSNPSLLFLFLVLDEQYDMIERISHVMISYWIPSHMRIFYNPRDERVTCRSLPRDGTIVPSVSQHQTVPTQLSQPNDVPRLPRTVRRHVRWTRSTDDGGSGEGRNPPALSGNRPPRVGHMGPGGRPRHASVLRRAPVCRLLPPPVWRWWVVVPAPTGRCRCAVSQSRPPSPLPALLYNIYLLYVLLSGILIPCYQNYILNTQRSIN